ncbi:MAG: AI-2E family transporter [Candidatus Acidiferrales bacterium]
MADRGDARLLGLATTVVVIAALYFARIVFIPLALAILFALLLTPPVTFLERLKMPRILAVAFLVGALISVAVLAMWQIAPQFADVTDKLPTYEKAVQEKIHILKRSSSERLNKASQSVAALEKAITPTITPASGERKSTSSRRRLSSSSPPAVEVVPPESPLESMRTVLGPLATGGIVMVFAVFILLGREDLRNRLIRLVYGGRLNVMTQAMNDAVQRINRYLFLQLVVNSAYGVLVGIVLHFIGIPDAPLWGLAAGILRFLPYIGVPLAALMPIVLAVAVFPGWSHALFTAGFFFVLEMIVANALEPLLYGAHVGLSPLAILVAAVFWTLIWGLPGLVLSTPMTVCLVVMGRHIPSLGFLDVLLGNEAALPPHTQYYQRLLAGDQNEAKQIVELYLMENSREALYSELMIPAMSLAEEDRHRGHLDPQTEQFINQSTREIIEDLADSPGDDESVPEPADVHADVEMSNHIDVLCIPARDDADDIVAALIAQLLQAQGQKSQSLPIGTRAEMLSQVRDLKPAAVCISALPPLAINHARELYAKLRMEFPALAIVVCIWNMESDPQKMAARLRLSRHHWYFSTVSDVLRHFAAINDRVVLPSEA